MHSEDSSQVDKTSHDRLDLRRQLDDSVEHAIADPAHSMTALRIFCPRLLLPGTSVCTEPLRHRCEGYVQTPNAGQSLPSG